VTTVALRPASSATDSPAIVKGAEMVTASVRCDATTMRNAPSVASVH
jgi:hypothetical protein